MQETIWQIFLRRLIEAKKLVPRAAAAYGRQLIIILGFRLSNKNHIKIDFQLINLGGWLVNQSDG